MHHTRRRLRGRQPLCGTGVQSRMRLILNPAELSARSADSRPAPGPLTSTVTLRTPCSIAFLAAASAASCAANGVVLRGPLNPPAPEVALDAVVGLDRVADLADVVLVEVVGLLVGRDTRLAQHHVGRVAAEAEDVREGDLDALVAREVDAGDSSHVPLLLTRTER